MTLRHIRPRSSDWVDAMEGGGSRGWEKLAPEERTKLRLGEYSAVWEKEADGKPSEQSGEEADFG